VATAVTAELTHYTSTRRATSAREQGPFADLRNRVREFIDEHCIVRVPPGSTALPAIGGHGYYTWQFYLRRALLDPACLNLVCEEFWIKNGERFLRRPFQVAGVESSSTPMITAIVLDWARRGLCVNAFTIRKERKAYGLRNIIEGAPSADPVVFIDDLTSPQHKALRHAMSVIRDARLELDGRGYVLVRKEAGGSASTIIDTSIGSITIDSAFSLSDFTLTL
jgi:orotate phosphoribosyltransferase